MGLGLVQKFTVTRNPEPYPPHEGEYFVLYPARDFAAMEALFVYAALIRTDNPELSAELHTWLKRLNTDRLETGR